MRGDSETKKIRVIEVLRVGRVSPAGSVGILGTGQLSPATAGAWRSPPRWGRGGAGGRAVGTPRYSSSSPWTVSQAARVMTKQRSLTPPTVSFRARCLPLRRSQLRSSQVRTTASKS